MSLINSHYFKSKDIKVFPSSFRGSYLVDGKTQPIVFDPESRLNTESNFTLPTHMMGKNTYIVEYSANNYIKFVLGGYYFEISNLSNYLNSLKNKYIGIKLREIELKEPTYSKDVAASIDNPRKTKVLNSWVASSNSNYILDIESEDADKNKTYIFTGLYVDSDEIEIADAVIKLFDTSGNINQTYVLADIDHGTGVNTLIHGQGLSAGYENQTVFGVYNANDENNLFEIGKGTSTISENAVDISRTTTRLNNDNIRLQSENVEVVSQLDDEVVRLKIDDETTEITNTWIKISGTAPSSEHDATNNKIPIILDGKTKIEGTTTVHGAFGVVGADTDVTNSLNGTVNIRGGVSITRNILIDNGATIKGTTNLDDNATISPDKTTLAKPVEITDDSINALKVFGDVAIAKELRVGGDDSKVLEVKPTVEDDAKNVTITGTLETTDKATLASLDVEGATTIEGTTTIKGQVNINQATTAQPVNINGDTTITGTVTIDGKATSTTTTSTDGTTTLTTKGYVDGLIDALDVTSVGENGKYLKTISEKDGKINATTQSFDKSFDSATDNNAPTTLAVKTHVTTEIGKLKVDQVGGDGKYIRSISEENGKITATAQELDTEITSSSSIDGIPSSNAVWTAIDNTFKRSIRPIDEQADYFFYWNTLTAGSPGIVKSGLGGWETFTIDKLIADGATAGIPDGNKKYTIEHVVSALSVGYGTSIGDRINGKEDGEQAEQMGRWGNAYYVDISEDKKTLYILNVNPWDAISVKVLLLLKRI